MTESIVNQLESMASYAPVWGFLLIFIFMTMESTVLPLPSEIVMIPAGFLAYRGELTFGLFWPDFLIAVIMGVAGSIAGAWINYIVSLKLGRPVLYRWGKYFFLPEHHLKRAEEIFREYGDIATFVCRLVPVMRHLISIPAGLSQMNRVSFTTYTAAGAGLWMVILTGVGAYLGKISGKDTTYHEIVYKGEALLHEHFWLVMAIPVVAVICYIIAHRKVMHSEKETVTPEQAG